MNSHDFVSPNRSSKILRNIRNAKAAKIVELAGQAAQICSYENLEAFPSVFFHTANSSIGAGRSPCSFSGCRLERVKELEQFAALYSDKVYISNFFDYHTWGDTTKEDLRSALANDLVVLSALLPLVEAEKVQMIDFGKVCPHCLTVQALSNNYQVQYEKAVTDLNLRFYTEVQYSLAYDEGVFSLKASGPDLLISHGRLGLVCGDSLKHKLLTIVPRVAKEAEAKGEVRLTTAQAKRIGVGEEFSRPILYNIAFELGGAHLLKTSYLSDSSLEINLIQDLARDPLARRSCSLMAKYLTTLVPFLDSVSTSDLLKLRESEEESFISFRAALTEAVEEYKKHSRGRFGERDAQAVYGDIILPRLANLDARINKARKSFIKDSATKVFSWVGAISVGVYTGIFSSSPLDGAAAFAAVKAGAELPSKVMGKSDRRESVKTDDMYFLWKVRKLSHPSDFEQAARPIARCK
jgi:hypothetical protein